MTVRSRPSSTSRPRPGPPQRSRLTGTALAASSILTRGRRSMTVRPFARTLRSSYENEVCRRRALLAARVLAGECWVYDGERRVLGFVVLEYAFYGEWA